MQFLKNAGRMIVVAFAAGFLAVLCLAVYGWTSGMLTAEKLAAARSVLAGEAAPAAASSAGPAKDLTEHYDAEALKERQRAIEDMRKQEAILLVQLNERRAAMTRLEAEAARIRKEVTDRAETFAARERAFAEAQAKQEKQVRGTGFRKEVETLQNMREKDAARMLYGMELESAVELLRAFDAGFRAGVVQEIDRLDRAGDKGAKDAKAPALLKLLRQGTSPSESKQVTSRSE